jgi:hypothetical protein
MENVLRPDFGQATSRAQIRVEMREQDELGSIVRSWYADKGNFKYQALLSREVDRQIVCYFDLNVQAMLRHLFDQTIQMGRDSWGFTYARIAKGDVMTNGVGCDERTAMRLVAQLAETGIIIKEPNSKGIQITFNLNWRPQPGQRRAYESRKRAPTMKRSDIPVTPAVTGMSPQPLTGMSPIREEDVGEKAIRGEAIYSAPASQDRERISDDLNFHLKDCGEKTSIAKQEPSNSPAASALPSSVETVTAKATRRTNERPATAKQKMNPGAIEETFRAAFEEAFHDYPDAIFVPWTPKERAIVNNALIKKWPGSPEELHDYVRWAVTHWSGIMCHRFSWMKRDRPEVPTLSFLIAQQKNFLQAHTSYRTDCWINSIKDQEERMYATLTIKGGKTPEEAQLEIYEHRAIVRMRDENRSAERRANDAWQKARIVEDRTKRMQPTVPHPNSPAAREARQQADMEAIRAAREANPIPALGAEEVPDFSNIPEWGAQ